MPLRFQYYILILIISTCAFGCQRTHRFDRTQAEILSSAKNAPGEIYISEGATGPYREGPGFVGNVNVAGSFSAMTLNGPLLKVSWPATPGFYYEAASYINESEEAFYVVRKIPAPK